MSRLVGILIAVTVVVVAMVFAVLNAGNEVTLNLGLFTLYRAPVALVAFGGLFVGMVVMFATGIHADLKVRRILRERLVEESREEQKWIDRNQQDLFEAQPELLAGAGRADPAPLSPASEAEADTGPIQTPAPEAGTEINPDQAPTPEAELDMGPSQSPAPEAEAEPDEEDRMT
jgi:uncharacterized integral membrane protein